MKIIFGLVLAVFSTSLFAQAFQEERKVYAIQEIAEDDEEIESAEEATEEAAS